MRKFSIRDILLATAVVAVALKAGLWLAPRASDWVNHARNTAQAMDTSRVQPEFATRIP